MKSFYFIRAIVLPLIIFGNMSMFGQHENTTELGFMATRNNNSSFISNKLFLGVKIPIRCHYKLEYNNQYISAGQFFSGKNIIPLSIPGISKKSEIHSFVLHLRYGAMDQKWNFSCHVSIKSMAEERQSHHIERKSRYRLSLLVNQQLLVRKGKQVTYLIPSDEVEDVFSDPIYSINRNDGSFRVPAGFSPFSVLAWFLQQKKMKKKGKNDQDDILQRMVIHVPTDLSPAISDPLKVTLQLVLDQKE